MYIKSHTHTLSMLKKKKKYNCSRAIVQRIKQVVYITLEACMRVIAPAPPRPTFIRAISRC